jgi:hypothetical protein
MTDNPIMFACGPSFGLLGMIVILAWIATPFVFLINVCLLPFRPRRSFLLHALVAGGCAGLGIPIWRNLFTNSGGWLEILFDIGVVAVPLAVIVQFMFLLVETIRAWRRRRKAAEMIPAASMAS